MQDGRTTLSKLLYLGMPLERVLEAVTEQPARELKFGEKIGLAFQLADDLLDLTSDAAAMGKATGKDAARGKGTLVALHGRQWAETTLARLVQDATDLFLPYGARADILIEAARFVANRKN